MDEQKVFNKIWQWAVVEGHPRCESPMGGCSYFSDGNRCWFGALLTEGLAKRAEHEQSGHLCVQVIKKIPGVYEYLVEEYQFTDSRDEVMFLLTIQSAHDNSDSTITLDERLMEIGERFHLEVPNL